MTPVRITIRTAYRNGQEEDAAVNEYSGKRFEKDGAAVLRYEERFHEEDAPVITTIYARDDEVRLHRKGSVGGDMVFCEGTPCEFFYRTGFGNLPMEVHTHALSVKAEGEGLTIRLDYSLFSQGDCVSETEMEITALSCPEL